MSDEAPTSLLDRLSTEEKIALLDGQDFWRTQALLDHGVAAVMLTDGPHGLRKQEEGGDHLGLADSVPATCFPPAVGLASSFDVDLLRRVGAALGRECRANGVAVLLGPGVNIKRSPLCGRNFEYFSEDPLLAGELAAAFVAGVQGEGVGTSLKHFAANNQETARMTVSAEVDERTLREIYLPAFETTVRRSQPWTVMCSYNRINGVYASQDPWLLTRVLREEWGFSGLVVSDWGAVDDRAAGVRAGLDLEMPSSGGSGAARVRDALQAGTLTGAELDRAVGRVLELLERAAPGLAEPLGVDVEAHHALAREAATRSAVLLENDGGLLPLAAHGGTVAVVGEFARTPRYQGAGSSQVNPTRLDDALSALRSALPGREITFSPGFTLATDPGEDDEELRAAAVAAATDADTVLVFLGLPAAAESEGYDRTHLELPAAQLAVLEAVLAANPRTVVVLSNGSVVRTSGWVERVPAVLEAWLLGQAGGAATADLLTGAVNPSGRLAETLPVRLADTPAVGNFPGEHGRVRYGEGLLVGYRWYDTRDLPVAFPFGHGLSYTTFQWSDLAVEPDGDGARVRVRVTNTGSRSGVETVQVYVHDREASVFRPEAELRGFARVELAPGEAQAVEVGLDRRAFAYWHDGHGDWFVEGGEFEIRVGASSRDVRARATIDLPGDERPTPLAADAEVGEFLAHPVVGPRLRERLGGGEWTRMLEDPVNGQMMRAVPLVRLTRFPGFPLAEDEIAGLTDATGGRVH
ncbi:glycoside hydrolase family 3 C-terminal domain-containing protein [Kineococcus gynurae]|uniref:Glycoside hydrolase family 3 C-terminal domain-containing protein n=1 Tax=Kineococcus gynurae TaxID=452979 RepID=A0ABV5LXI3_9ACTN